MAVIKLLVCTVKGDLFFVDTNIDEVRGGGSNVCTFSLLLATKQLCVGGGGVWVRVCVGVRA